MNKNLFFGVASSILLPVLPFLTSCGEDELPERKPLKELQSVVIKYIDSSFSTEHFELTYDNMGRIVKKGYFLSSSADTTVLTLTYGDNTFSARQVSKDTVYDYSGELTSKGYISKYQTGITDGGEITYSYVYNDLGQMTSYTMEINNSKDQAMNLKTTETFKWTDGNLVELNGEFAKYVCSFSKEEKYRNIGKLKFYDFTDLPDAAYGVASEYLPITSISIKEDGTRDTTNYIYTFDADGYPLTVTMNDSYREFTWKDTGR